MLQDLERAQVELAESVYVMCNKQPADVQQEDLVNTMRVLSIGQYIQVSIRVPSFEQYMQVRLWSSSARLFAERY
jgi:hypothetical protein